MALYHIQDNDRPAFVVADSLTEAVAKWRKAVDAENTDSDVEPIEPIEPYDPQGVVHVCDDDELIIGEVWEG